MIRPLSTLFSLIEQLRDPGELSAQLPQVLLIGIRALNLPVLRDDLQLIMVLQSQAVTLVLVLSQTASHLLQEGPHYSGPDAVVGEKEVQHGVVHLAVVGATEALPQEVHSLLVFSLSGVIEHQRPPQGMKGRKSQGRD